MLEDEVVIYAGATILGGDTVIGARSEVAGGVFVTSSVPPDHVVAAQKTRSRVISREHLGSGLPRAAVRWLQCLIQTRSAGGSMPHSPDPFGARTAFQTPVGEKHIYSLDALRSLGDIDRLPLTIKVLLESCLRNCDGMVVTEEHVRSLVHSVDAASGTEIAFTPGRVVLQDFTGVPCVVDLAAMRDAMQALGGDPNKVNPLVPCDLVIDHSVQVDEFNSGVALTVNAEKEFARNRERYEFLKWGQQAFDNFRVVPPATGIVHQVNLE